MSIYKLFAFFAPMLYNPIFDSFKKKKPSKRQEKQAFLRGN